MERQEALEYVAELTADQITSGGQEATKLIERIMSDEKVTLDDLGADSLDKVELTMEAEDLFGSSIPDEDAEKMTCIKDLIDYILAENFTPTDEGLAKIQKLRNERLGKQEASESESSGKQA